jgi:hypothetical protein
MKKVCLTLILSSFVLALLANSALALPAFNKAWQAKYLEGNSNAAFVDAVGSAKCNVCHDANSKSKKDKNEYGKAVGKHLTKKGYEKLKSDPDAVNKYIVEGLEKAASEKSSSGKTFAELIKEGKLPGGQ